ncbi:hypothetical protein GOBAR_AA07357 [Gossypium barbadense]|uniref:Reverse transcriptase zinc-binding domain-containing protein n=1 Tax=Gossypium barbadense TaxID=3634 RepID=A0A2P5YCI7_GOSBA|nr:hypothetical protein GOBAR_AA07357 [Gossypium barbadense]
MAIVAPKVKERLLHNFVPCKARLLDKGLSISPDCAQCGDTEDLEAVFLQCTHSVQIWRFASLSISQVFVNKFVEQLFDSDFVQSRDRILTILWSIWEANGLFERVQPRRPATSESATFWQPPPEGTLKCNVDAALRDSWGVLVGWCSFEPHFGRRRWQLRRRYHGLVYAR